MPSLTMERGRQKLQNILEDGLGRDLMNAGRFCFSCEQIFANRKCLEEHVCSAASYICSCGTEFTEYRDMLEHSTTHEPGHQVLNHQTIRKRRIEKRIEEENQLKRLQTGEVVWKMPKLNSAPPASLPVKSTPKAPVTSAGVPQAPTQSAQMSQVPGLYPSVSQASLLPNSMRPAADMKNVFSGVGAPTVDLWTLYQPVVLLETVRTFSKQRSYTCGKCGQCFLEKTSLISHHSNHVTDKVSGCIGCGLLLSSKKVVPRFHVCNAPNTATKFRLITARPPGNMRTSQSLSARGPLATSSLQLKNQNPSAASKGSQAPRITSPLQYKSMSAYNKSNQGLHVTPSLLFKNPSASKPYVNISLSSKSQSRGLPFTPSRLMKTLTNSASGVPSRPPQASSASKGFTCRVCHIPFESAQLLQRHKCAKAREFMARTCGAAGSNTD